jgi:hypothetical protein
MKILLASTSGLVGADGDGVDFLAMVADGDGVDFLATASCCRGITGEDIISSVTPFLSSKELDLSKWIEKINVILKIFHLFLYSYLPFSVDSILGLVWLTSFED